MSSNNLKINVGAQLGLMARQKALDHLHLTHKGELPASVVSIDKTKSIMTIKFETDGTYTLPNVTIPLDGPEYLRYPIQKGDKGVVRTAATVISNMTGLGPNSPSGYTTPGNLASLIFHPVGNSDWSKTEDDKLTGYGPKGTTHRPTDSSSVAQTGANSSWHGSVPSGTVDPTNITPASFKHTVTTDDTDGVKNTSTKEVSHNAPKVNVNASDSHNITSPQTNITGNASISGIMSAALAAIGGIAGVGGAPASAASGLQISGGTNPALAIAYQYVAPSTGATLTVSLASPILIIEPAGTLAALTINWPAGVDSVMVWISCSQPVTAVTHSGATFAANASFASFPAGGGQFRFIYVAGTVNKWFRI